MKVQYESKKTVSLFKKKAKEGKSSENLHIFSASDYKNGRTLTYPPNSQMKFVHNGVKTSKYSLITWAPKSLLWQFRRISNIYFLIISILSALSFSPKSPFSMGGTFAGVLIFTMLKEGWEDYFRHRQDEKVNSVPAHKYCTEKNIIINVQTKQLKVGDIVMVNNEESFPADLILLSSSNPNHLAYVNTANLDGENNLKEKKSVDTTQSYKDPSSFKDLIILIECDEPNALFSWNCNIKALDKHSTGEKIPIGMKELLLKGCILKNTKFIYGLIVYTGHDTKIVMNSKKAPNKISTLLKKMNKILYSVFAFQIILCFSFSVLSMNIKKDLKKHFYLDLSSSDSVSGYFIQALTFWVAYSHLIPISLYVALEILKLFLAYLINQDLDMYYKNAPAKCKSSDLIEELGQIEFVFSDKTGTLTCNEMVFRKCFVNGIVYGKRNDEFGKNDSIENLVMTNFKDREHFKLEYFFKFLAVCNSVFTTKDQDGEVVYEASSPDELALLQGASKAGVVLSDKTQGNVHIRIGDKSEHWEILEEIPFTSERKRMSVIVRLPKSNKILLMTKGADSTLLLLLAQKNLEDLNSSLTSFATDGLRCLVMGQKILSGKDFHNWHDQWKKAKLLSGHEKIQTLDQLAETIETNLDLVGCTGIEDKLQQGVPETIELLISAGIRIWVLTGDKEETAIEIGKSCSLIQKNMNVIKLSSDSQDEVARKLYEYDRMYQLKSTSFKLLDRLYKTMSLESSVVIDGKTLAWIFADKNLQEIFFKLGFVSVSCICCRVSPSQKMEVVRMARFYGDWRTLAIGDGANDVSMIQEANVGIGISGKEGTQACQSADFVISQFRFLGKFLLVHGRWGYKRVSWFIYYYFYKNIAIVFTEIWFAIFNGFSGQIFFMDWLPMLYNSFWTSWPCLITYALEQDIEANTSLQRPQLYKLGQQGYYFTFTKFWKWVILGIWHGSLAFWICISSNNGTIDLTGQVQNLWWFSTLAFSLVINIVTLKLYLENLHWTFLSL